MTLTQQQIADLLGPQPVRVEQRGPVRWFDKEMQCASKRCDSPTYMTVFGMPECMIHAIRLLNEKVYELESRESQEAA